MIALGAALLLMLAAACGDTSDGDPSSPITPPTTVDDGDDLIRGPVFISGVEIVLMESWPVQVRANISGDLPTPCHQFAYTVAAPGDDGTIDVDVYTLVVRDVNCAQVLDPFEESIPIGDFTEGDYTVLINGEPYEFTI